MQERWNTFKYYMNVLRLGLYLLSPNICVVPFKKYHQNCRCQREQRCKSELYQTRCNKFRSQTMLNQKKTMDLRSVRMSICFDKHIKFHSDQICGLMFFSIPWSARPIFRASSMIIPSTMVAMGLDGQSNLWRILFEIGWINLDGKIGHILNSTMIVGHIYLLTSSLSRVLWRVQERLDVNNMLFLRVSTEVHHRPNSTLCSMYILSIQKAAEEEASKLMIPGW